MVPSYIQCALFTGTYYSILYTLRLFRYHFSLLSVYYYLSYQFVYLLSHTESHFHTPPRPPTAPLSVGGEGAGREWDGGGGVRVNGRGNI